MEEAFGIDRKRKMLRIQCDTKRIYKVTQYLNKDSLLALKLQTMIVGCFSNTFCLFAWD